MFYLAQVLVAFYAYCIASKEGVFIRALRQYVPINNPYNKPFHAYGWKGAATLGLSLTLLQDTLPALCLVPLLSLLLYSVVYDAVIGRAVYGDPFYLGTSADTDIRLRKWLGDKAGQRKVTLCAGAFLILNLLYLFL